jgi:hypothetical protein
MKARLLVLNHIYIFLMASIYIGLFTSLHFFWFPSFESLTVSNYYDQIIPQTTRATQFFFVTIPIMYIAMAIMTWSEWRTKFRWVPIACLIGISIPVYIQQGMIERVNDALKVGVTDQAQLSELLQRWMSLNDLRWIVLSLVWAIMAYYFIAKGNLLSVIEPPKKR